MKFFNTVGVTDPARHYFLPRRLDWEQLVGFIEKQYYFVLHAPRQSGKTTAIIEFVKYLNKEGKYAALYLSTESARIAVNDVNRALRAIIVQLKNQIPLFLDNQEYAIEYLENLLKQEIQESSIYDFLRFWSEKSTKPLTIFFDEFDVLAGDSLITLLTQLRTGYTNRPQYFPQSICLIGVRDLRDYKVKTTQEEELRVLYSPFNIKAESLLLPNFSQEDVKTLYLQHTAETGQQFTDEALAYAFQQTQGQPWLVNALAYQACFRDVQDRTQTITKEVIERAQEALIARRDTHLDALVDRLKEPRVRKIMDVIVSSSGQLEVFNQDDVQYVRDLGLIRQKDYVIANPIYQEIIPRTLLTGTQQGIIQESSWYQNPDGSLNMKKLLQAFTQFFRENSEVWLERFDYKESGPHLLLMAFLQRVINGGGRIHREYALGRKRVDLLVSWQKQRVVIELKILRGKDTLPDGLRQTAEYMDKSRTTEGHLVIFDRSPEKTWDEKIYHQKEFVDQRSIDVWGM
ncbi:AAA-like domain-containing protein [Candidatus Babeliales bacterium]|nr:AAA-like domain-containing protein [Candidatus Babeliales bacterium]